MSWFTRESSLPELTLLRRRIELLERQVEALAAFTGIDPNHLPSELAQVDDEARALVEEGRLVDAARVHQEKSGLDPTVAKADIDAVAQGHL